MPSGVGLNRCFYSLFPFNGRQTTLLANAPKREPPTVGNLKSERTVVADDVAKLHPKGIQLGRTLNSSLVLGLGLHTASLCERRCFASNTARRAVNHNQKRVRLGRRVCVFFTVRSNGGWDRPSARIQQGLYDMWGGTTYFAYLVFVNAAYSIGAFIQHSMGFACVVCACGFVWFTSLVARRSQALSTV